MCRSPPFPKERGIISIGGIMKIQDMFVKDINRSIQGVVKVDDNEATNLLQELEEYVITAELKKHFETFTERYKKSLGKPSENIGVWISGFFGSGKSHFLKMLSYLLSGKVVNDMPAVSYFKEKFDSEDALLYADLVKCCSIPTESILFNIDNEGRDRKDATAILYIFAKMFYKHLGFYGESLKVAFLERFLQKEGKRSAFSQKYKEEVGIDWEADRASFAFREDQIVSVLQDVLGMTEAAARNWYNDDDHSNISIAQLVKEICDYADSKGKDFRLLYCIDEVGQYIGEDRNLMLNLQTIVEELGTKCKGKVWVLVTSQEAVDSLVKLDRQDFSKILDRFDTRLSLSSASTDEVIKKRILQKNEDAQLLLGEVYKKEQATLKNLFAFSKVLKQDITGYSNDISFKDTYPFVPYQFKILPDVFTNLRAHGHAGMSLSSGERSMLSVFVYTAQKIKGKDDTAIAPFWMFYDAMESVLTSTTRKVMDRCIDATKEKDNDLKPDDEKVLKLLYLLRFITDLPANKENITILMAEGINTDKIALGKRIESTLNRLLTQNYIIQKEEVYSFLTDEEQEFEQGIKNTVLDNHTIITQIGNTIFNDILNATRKIRMGSTDIPFDQYIDDTRIGTAQGEVFLRFLTPNSDLYNSLDKIRVKSQTNREVIVLLEKETQYWQSLETATKIDLYIKSQNLINKPKSVEKIIADRRKDAKDMTDRAKKQIEIAIMNSDFYIYGRKEDIRKSDAKAKIESAMKILLENVFDKLSYLTIYCDNENDIAQILAGKTDPNSNIHAQNELNDYIDNAFRNDLTVTMSDVQYRYQRIPYGWREIDISATVARLMTAQKVEIHYGGVALKNSTKNITDYLRKRNLFDKVSIKKKIEATEEDKKKAIDLLREWTGSYNIPTDHDGLLQRILETLKDKRDECDLWLVDYSHRDYPQKEVVETMQGLLQGILDNKNNDTALIKTFIDSMDSITEQSKKMKPIQEFFSSQKTIFDKAYKLYHDLQNDKDYFTADSDITSYLDKINEILTMEQPYDNIKDLPTLMQNAMNNHKGLLDTKKEEVLYLLQKCMGEVHTLAETGKGNARVKSENEKADNDFTGFKQNTISANSLNYLDALTQRLQNYTKKVCQNIEEFITQETQGTNPQKAIATIKRHDLFSATRLTTPQDIDNYLDDSRDKLLKLLKEKGDILIT